jgi:hypothetical protein
MGRTCSLQQHKARMDIDTLIRQGRSIRSIAVLKGVTPGSVQRHAAHIDTCPPHIDTAIDTPIGESIQHTDTPANISIQSGRPAGESAISRHAIDPIPYHGPGFIEVAELLQRCDRIEMSIASLHGRFDNLDAGMMEVWKRLEGLHDRSIDAPVSSPLVTPPELDTDGLIPHEAMRVCLQAMQQVWKRTPLRERSSLGRMVGEVLQGMSSGEEL